MLTAVVAFDAPTKPMDEKAERLVLAPLAVVMTFRDPGADVPVAESALHRISASHETRQSPPSC